MKPYAEMIKPAPIRTKDIQKAVDLALRATDKEVEVNYLLWYWNWDSVNQPTWKIVGPRTWRGDRELVRKTVSTPFVWVDLGTGAHPIVARNTPTLSFQVGSIPKTMPGRFGSGPSATFGEWISPKKVMHPGIEPRDISIQVCERADGVFVGHMDHYMDGAII